MNRDKNQEDCVKLMLSSYGIYRNISLIHREYSMVRDRFTNMVSNGKRLQKTPNYNYFTARNIFKA